MVYPPCPCCTEREEFLSHHALKLDILRFFAVLLLDKSEDSGRSNGSLTSALAKRSSKLIEPLQSVLTEVRTVTQALLERLLSGSCVSESVSTLFPIPALSHNVCYRILTNLRTFSMFREIFAKFSLRKNSITHAFRFCRSSF